MMVSRVAVVFVVSRRYCGSRIFFLLKRAFACTGPQAEHPPGCFRAAIAIFVATSHCRYVSSSPGAADIILGCMIDPILSHTREFYVLAFLHVGTAVNLGEKHETKRPRQHTTENAGETVYLLTPFVDGGELFDWVRNNGASTEDVVKPLFRQIVDGLRVREGAQRAIEPPNETNIYKRRFACF